MKKLKNKKIWSIFLVCILIICMCVPAFGMDNYGSNPNTVPKTKSYGYEYAADWGINDYSNITEYPFISYTGKIVNKTNIQYFTDYRVFGIDLSKYICVGYTYMYGGFKFLTVLAYDKDTKEYISAVPTYHKMCSQDIILGDGTLEKHEDVEGGSLGFNYSEHILDTNVPIFDSKLACDDYAKTGKVDGAVALPKCEAPQKLDVYCANDNMYDLTLIWQQYQDTTDLYSIVEVGWVYNFDLNYHMPPNYFDNGLPEVFKKNSQIINNNYDTSSVNKIKFNISNIVNRYALANDTDNVCFVFVIQNRKKDNSELSKYSFVRVFVDKNGVSVYSSGSDDNSYNKQPIKNETDYSKDNGYSYTKDDFTTINSTSNEGFINSIISGFGLIGNNGLLSLLGGVFAYIPEWLWVLIGTGVTFMVIIALFKLVVH